MAVKITITCLICGKDIATIKNENELKTLDVDKVSITFEDGNTVYGYICNTCKNKLLFGT